ncbi:MAG: SBBP repeat-containing protein [Blastocatellia bacterium]
MLSFATFSRSAKMLLFIFVSLGLAALFLHHSQPSPAVAPAARVQEAYGRVPLSFEANHGQVNEAVQFLTRTNGQNLFLTATETVIAPQQNNTANPLRLKLKGANAKPTMKGEEQLAATANYFLGNDPQQWRTNIPTYARVKYESVYPGIDLVYYGNQQQLEYDFLVAPGAQPQTIQLEIAGAEKIHLDEQGNLVLTTAAGEVVQHKPIVYQEVNGARQEVAGSYVLQGENNIGFAIGEYDASKPLVIDPVLSYSTFLGGTKGQDSGSSIAVDAAGCAYITGSSWIDFPHSQGAAYPTFTPNSRMERMQAIFVMKLNPGGTAPIYSALIGGTEGYSYTREGAYPDDPQSYELSNTSQDIALDHLGNAYVIGITVSKNFPISPNAFRKTSVGFIESKDYTIDNVVFKLSADGSQLVYSSFVGSNTKGIAVDAYGCAWLTGVSSYRTPMPTTPDAYQPQMRGASDVFLTHLNADGSGLLYSTFLGGSTDGRSYNAPPGIVRGGADVGSGVALDKAGNVYVTGATYSIDFPKTPGTFTVQEERGSIIVAKFTPRGRLVFSTCYGSLYTVAKYPVIAVDDASNIYITGATPRSDFPVTFGAYQTAGGAPDLYSTNIDAFVTKISADGSAILYSTFFGGINGNELGMGIAADSAGNAYVVGNKDTSEGKPSDFPLTDGTQARSSQYGGFAIKLNPTGTQLLYSTLLGDSNAGVQAMALDGSGNVYVTGGARFGYPTTPNAYQRNWGGLTEPLQGSGYYDHAFVTKIAAMPVAETPLPGPSPKPTPIAATAFSVIVNIRDSNGQVIPKVELNITGTLPVVNEAGSNSTGSRLFTNVPVGGDYTVTVAADGYTFTPSSYTVRNLRADQQVSFTAIVPPTAGAPSISGKVVDRAGLRGAGVAGVTVTLNDTPPRTIVTDETGKFVFGNLIAGLDYAVSLARGSSRFDPAQQVFPAVSGTITAPNFVLRPASAARPLVNVSAASYTRGLACETIATAFGSGLATTTRSNNLIPMPTLLGGTSVYVKDSLGVERLAPLFFVSPTQVNYLLPVGTASGEATITIVSGDGTAFIETLPIEDFTPGLFSADATGKGVAAAAVQRVQASGAQSYEAVAQFDFTKGQFMPLPISVATDTERVYLTLFGTGIRNSPNLARVTARIGGIAAPVTYAGTQGVFAGLDQVNVMLPSALAGRGEVDVELSVDGKLANTVRVKIK